VGNEKEGKGREGGLASDRPAQRRWQKKSVFGLKAI
jgi:hypothetical protein